MTGALQQVRTDKTLALRRYHAERARIHLHELIRLGGMADAVRLALLVIDQQKEGTPHEQA